ncbi:juvenile hormone acid O-methyltransferase-like [Branchiostoma floridae x Branchiostoma japonicum]
MDTSKPERYSQNSYIQYILGVEALQQYMQWEEGDTVLDAGCGTGEICKFISQQPGVASVLGFDVSHDFVSYASQHNSAQNILYHVADVSYLSTIIKPEWRGAFSKVVSFSVLHWVRDKVTALKALHSCLKPGGEIVMIIGTDKSKTLQTYLKMAAHPRWETYLKDFVPNLFPWPSGDLVNHSSRLLEECGFEVLSCHVKEHRHLFESKEKLRDALCAIYPHLHYIPQDKHGEFKHDVENIAREAHLISGRDGHFKITEKTPFVRARKL